MRYTVSNMNGLSWSVEKEDGDEYTINFNIFKQKFTCSCVWNMTTEKTCRHIRMVKEYIVHGKEEYDE